MSYGTVARSIVICLLLSCGYIHCNELHIAAAAGLIPLQNLVSNYSEADVASKLTECDDGTHSPKEFCDSVLHVAAYKRQAAVVRYLVSDLKADINMKNADKKTPLHRAFESFTVFWHPCEEDFVSTVKTILSLGGDPTIPFSYGGEPEYTVLHFEAFDGNRHGLLPALIEAGANVSAVDSRGYTPVHAAARCDFRLSCDDCGCFEDKPCGGGNVTCPDNLTGGGVHFFGAAPTLKYLIARGADPLVVGKDGVRAIDRVPVPENPGDPQAWVTGTCKTTYEYLKSLESTTLRG